MVAGPLVRVVEAGLGPEAQVRLVVSRVSDPARLRSAWSSSGAVLEQVGERLHATTTVEALARAAGRSLGADEAGRLDRDLRQTIAACTGPAAVLILPGGRLATDVRPAVMGILNVTPDSFSDGGALYPGGHPGTAVAVGLRLLSEGADLLDVGGESTRPGAQPVESSEELRRVLPVIEALAGEGACVSVDTSKAVVARAATAAGAAIVNDVSGARDPALLDAVAQSGAGYVLMHTRGTPADMQRRATYDDVVAEVYEFLADGLERCEEAGIPFDHVLVDPGLGFAKTPKHNLALLRALRQFRGLCRPVLVGASRKSFLGEWLGRADPADRLEGSLACVAAAVSCGAAVVRVHDVRPTVSVARVTHAIATGHAEWPVAAMNAPTARSRLGA